MEIEVVGICKGFDENDDLIIIDDDNDDISMDNQFFKIKPLDINKYINKRVSFYYTNTDYSIELINDTEKQTCLNYNFIQGNYYMTLYRTSQKFLINNC
jgi:hypothetical protein